MHNNTVRRLCGSVEADHSHIFWNCTKINIYWENVNAVVKNILGFVIPNSSLVIYLGNIEDVMMREKVLLAASKKVGTR